MAASDPRTWLLPHRLTLLPEADLLSLRAWLLSTALPRARDALHAQAERAAPYALLAAQVALALAAVAAVRAWQVRPRRAEKAKARARARAAAQDGAASQKGKKRPREETCSVAVLLGSGGHTTEMLQLLRALPPERYAPRTYLVSSGDALSAAKAHELERELQAQGEQPAQAVRGLKEEPPEIQARVVALPRARRVHQPLLTVPWTLCVSLLACLWLVALRPLLYRGCGAGRKRKRMLADVLLLNGPGTCVAVALAVHALRMLALPAPRVIYVESFARVRSLSLSGGAMRFLADRFVVQWPQLLPHAEGDERAEPRAAATPSADAKAAVQAQGRPADARTQPPRAGTGDIECIGWLV